MKIARFAWRNFFRNSKSNITLVFLMVFGVVALIVAYGFIQSTFTGLKESSIHRDIGHFQIMDKREKLGDTDTPLEFGIERDEYEEIEKAILKNIDKVEAIMPRVSFSGIISKDEKSTIFMGSGINVIDESKFASVFIKIIDGKNLGLDFEEPNKNEVIIGRELALILKAKVGDDITLMSTTVDGAINAIDLVVSGIFVTGIEEVDKRAILTPLRVSQEILRTDKITKVVVGLYDTNEALSVFDQTKTHMKDTRLSFYFWEELSMFYKAVVSLYNTFFTFLGGLIALVVLSTVFGSVNSTVISRTKEIGMLKANGFTNNEVLSLIFLEVLILSFMAMIIAFVLGQSVIYIINALQLTMPPPPGSTEGYPLQLEYVVVESIFICFTLPFISLLASLRPAFKGAELKIAQALRS